MMQKEGRKEKEGPSPSENVLMRLPPHSWTRTPRIFFGGVYYIKFVRNYNGIRRLGGGVITLTPACPGMFLLFSPFPTHHAQGKPQTSILICFSCIQILFLV